MLASRERNSTAIDWLLAVALAAAVIVGAAGIDVQIGGLHIRAHSVGRVLLVAGIVFALRYRLGITAWVPWLLRLTLITSVVFSVATWFRFLLTTIGGADSYGYVSASAMLRHLRLIDPAPIADWLSTTNRLAVASPLGWAPAPDASGIVPTYALGLPMLMAAFATAAGSGAVFYVAPAFGLLTLVLIYRLARKWFDEDVALMAVMVTAWNPVFVTYAKQPMSDVPASALLLLAFVLTVRASKTSGFFAGVAAGFIVMIRPALLVVATVIPALANRRVAVTAAGLAIGVSVQAALQAFLFGSAFRTGYGSAEALFSPAYLPVNVGLFSQHIWGALSGMWLTGLVVGLIVAPSALTWSLLAVTSTVLLPYLFYLPFDHWETLRFLLPALVPLSLLVGAGLVRIARAAPNDTIAALLLIVFTTGYVVRNATFLRDQSVWSIQAIEARYPLAGQWLNVNTPANSVALANQHSGSLRWYGHRQTLRWDLLPPEDLVTTVADLERHGAAVYVVLEGAEADMFEARFAGVLDRLQVDHVGSIRNVSFRRIRARVPEL
jgi:hypothetical protein